MRSFLVGLSFHQRERQDNNEESHKCHLVYVLCIYLFNILMSTCQLWNLFFTLQLYSDSLTHSFVHSIVNVKDKFEDFNFSYVYVLKRLFLFAFSTEMRWWWWWYRIYLRVEREKSKQNVAQNVRESRICECCVLSHFTCVKLFVGK